MKALSLFLALLLSLSLTGCKNLAEAIFLLLALLLCFFLSVRKKAGRFCWGGLCSGLLLGILLRVGPLPYSPKIGIVVRCSDNYYVLLCLFDRFYVSSRLHSFEVGDVLRIGGEITPLRFSSYESRFDFASYLADLGVKGELVPAKGGVEVLLPSPFRLRAYSSYCLRGFSSDCRAMILSSLLNRKQAKNGMVQRLEKLNLLFLFSSSGIVASFFLSALEKRLFRHFTKEQSAYATAVASFVLCILSPYKIGLWRLLITRIYTLINNKHDTLFRSFEITSFAGITLLLANPFLSRSSAFWIGFGASLFSYFANGFFLLDKKEGSLIPRFFLFQGFLLPVVLESGGGVVHFLSPFFSFFFLPFAGAYAFLGLFALLGLPFSRLGSLLTSAFSSYLSFFEKYDLSFALFPSSKAFLYAYYFLFLLCSYLLRIGDRHRALRWGVLYSLCLAASYSPLLPCFSQEVSFINVGQGDSILIRDGANAVLLDTGGSLSFDMAEETLIPYLRKKRIYKLNALIASHGDFDHIGAKDSLMKNFEVLSFYSDPSSFPLDVGSLHFENLNVYPWGEENQSSLVLSLSFLGKTFLFTGDATKEVERRILQDHSDLSCDVLKVGHHGSDTSTCEEWLDALKPKEAVISVGYGNKYGHPSPDVVGRLEERGIRIRRTDLEGTVSYTRWAFPTI